MNSLISKDPNQPTRTRRALQQISGLLNAAIGGGGLGTVTSVGLTMPAIFSVAGSPVTTSGSFSVTLGNQATNSIFGGPASGAAAPPTFRAMVAADMPSVGTPGTYGTNKKWPIVTTDAQGRITAVTEQLAPVDIEIGAPVTGGSFGWVLYIDGAGNLAGDSGLKYSGSLLTLSGTAPAFTLSDDTPAAKSMAVTVDANLVNFREDAAPAGSLLVLDLANDRVGIGIAPALKLHVNGSIQVGAVTDVIYSNLFATFSSAADLDFSYSTANMTWTSSTGEKMRLTSGGLLGIGVTVPAAKIDLDLGTITTNRPAINSIATWNAGGVTFTHVLHNVTDTASAAASLLMDLQKSSVSQFKVTKAGAATMTGALTVGGSGAFTGNVTCGGNAVSNPTVTINGAAATTRGVFFQTGGVNRWMWLVDSTAESGSDAGSNLIFRSRTDAGASKMDVLNITRSGVINVAGNLIVNQPATTTIAGILKSIASRTVPLLQLQTSAGASLGNVGGTIFNDFTDTSSTSTDGTENDLYSYTIAANTLLINGDSIHEIEHIQLVSSATATRRIKKYFAGTLIFDSTALTLTLGGDFFLETTVIRETSTVVRCSVNVVTTSASTVPYATYTRITGLTLSGTNILKTTGIAAGAGAASGDIVEKLSKVFNRPAA